MTANFPATPLSHALAKSMPPHLRTPSRVRSLIALAGLVLANSVSAQFTEVTSTVKPGSFLLEMDALSLVIDREAGDKSTAFAAGAFLVTTGLTKNWDLQLGAELFISQRIDLGGLKERNTGIGDIYVRTKWRFYEDERFEIALIPFAKIPSNTGGVGNDSVEGGLIVPWQAYLFGAVTLNAMVEVDVVRNARDDGYGLLWYGSAALSRELTKSLAVYAEIDAAKTSGTAPWQTTVGLGVYWSVTPFLAWDFAVYRGLSRVSPDWNPVVRVNVGF
ncbi:MAG: transporter [Candidatus Didemnitutus sp.]|nr:transporter [Candidatus Didemnitutus sp.]